MSEGLPPDQQRLREEFNQWAAQGKGASMARHHAAITDRAIAEMAIAAGDRALDLGCGSGWAARKLASLVGPRGLVVGVDVSDAMIRVAQQHPEAPRNVRYFAAPAERLPVEPGFFTHVLSVESFYYYSDQRAVLDELKRVVAPGGRIFILMCLYTGNPVATKWQEQLAVPVHLRSAEEYRTMLGEAGWLEAEVEEFAPDPGDPNPDEHAFACLAKARRP